MRSDMLADAIGQIQDDYILDAENCAESGLNDRDAVINTVIQKDSNSKMYKDAQIDRDDKSHLARQDILSTIMQKKKRFGFAIAAACLCLIIVGGIILSNRLRKDSTAIQQWSASMTANDYFANSGKKSSSTSSSASLIMMPYAISLSLDDSREDLENSGVIPVISDHPENSFLTAYNGDGSLYKVSFLWMRRGTGLEEYSDLTFTAAPKELHEISDVITVRTDLFGNEIPPYVTATERDGITIFAEGEESENKSITWQTDRGWYQITGSWNDSYESVINLLDWFWEHPFDLTGYATIPSEAIICSDRNEYPDAFCDQIPDFAQLGYSIESENVNLTMIDGRSTPVWFEGIYTRGGTRIRWTINTGADADAWSENIGRPSETTEEKLTEALTGKDHVNIFFNMPCMATLKVESGTAADAWEVIQSLR